MSEELIQRDLLDHPDTMGEWNYYNIGNTSLRDLRAARIVPNRSYKGLERKKPDALVARNGRVLAAIEYKRPEKLRTQAQIETAIQQEIETAHALGAKVYVVTDGQKTIWMNPETGNRILDEDGAPLVAPFDSKSDDCIALLNRIAGSIGPHADQIVPIALVDPLPLATKVWQDLWAVSSATPENCLYSFVEIFIFKYLSDLGILNGMYSFSYLLRQYREEGNTEEAVLQNYARNIRPMIKQLFPAGRRDNTTIINGTIFVSKDERAVSGYATVFHKILERFASFVSLQNIDRDFKSRLFETFLKESISKKNWGQFFTPIKVVRAIVDMVDVVPGMTICDPACGVGKFLLEPVAKDVRRFFPIENGRIAPKIRLEGFDKGFDREEQKTIILAKANMLIYLADVLRDDPSQANALADIFNDTFFLQTNTILGTLANPVENRFDLILTNPPYVMSGSSNLKDEIAKDARLRKYFAVSAMGIEGLFMEWIVRALKPGGKAFVVVPDGILNRANDRRLREFILEQCNLDAVISLPINTFFTTNKKTYILALTKKVPSHVAGGGMALPPQTDPVFTYYCSEIGESRDTYRFDIPKNDLKSATRLFNMFKGAKTAFQSSDGRCKIVPVEAFRTGSHWCVEKWWTQAEKVALGIEEDAKIVDVSGFRTMLADMASSFGELDEMLAYLEKKNGLPANLKTFTIDSLFDIRRGSGRFVRRYVREHEGPYPVFSGNTFGAFAHVDEYAIEVPCLSWTIDGLAGYMMVHETPFSATNHRGVLFPKVPGMNLRYLKSVIEPIFRAAKKGREGDGGTNEYTSLPPSMVAKLEIQLPVDATGGPDIAWQNDCATRQESLRQVKDSIRAMGEEVAETQIVVPTDEYPCRKYPLSELFEMKKGLSKYTKRYGNEHQGVYPVYSASSQTPLTHIDTYDYEGRYMTWSTNGFAGTILVLEGKFSVNGDRGVLIPRGGRSDLDFDYMKYTLEPLFRTLAKGRKGDRGEDEFTKLYPSMLANIEVPVPVDCSGNIDVAAQRAIAEKHRIVEQCQQEFVRRAQELVRQTVNV